ncbi:D-glycero-beta-D-manno-heptose 1,7-bisphosphate 7-phosphatase [uncultured Gimesia sp.]|jgi:D-glycero-D-manno-heptose 1,7-bisphosphate phosphatase|uniref:D-glycero-beta-D-manno-heptose 1,7-bisphosphate 7-phosphatase n=1 Tax=uncultured Gimesia sp. TaxID=1678688 RepID=UPI00262C76F3|nr:D-glycero-beta-D-manno-heptose 1,7-bisphosphate 7-phosphatase [uncultured Gimesia sp.]
MQVQSSPEKTLFLDRDGVINKEKHYLHRVEDFEFIDGIFELCQAAVQSGYGLIIVTNQSGIARGYYTEQQFHDLMSWVVSEFAKREITISDVFYCPHHPIQGTGRYRIDCACRKPKPNMLLEAAKKHNLNLSESILVGDKLSDIKAGQSARLRTTALVGTGHTVSEQAKQTADVFAGSLAELKQILFPVSITAD